MSHDLPDYHALQTPHPPRPAANTPAPSGVAANYPRIILFAAAVFLFYRFFAVIGQALLLFGFAALFAVVLNAPVRFLEVRGVKRGFSVAAIAVLLLAGIGATAYLAVPPLAAEAVSLAQKAPERATRLRERLIEQAKPYPQVAAFVEKNPDLFSSEMATRQAAALLPRVGRATLGGLGAIATGLILTVLTLYMIADPKPLVRGVISAVPPAHRKRATHALTRIAGQIEGWAVATLILMVVVGVISGLGLWALGVPNAVLFGVLAGFGEAIPTVGPILSAVPPFAVAVADEPTKGIKVLVLFLAVQQIENNLLVPFIMGKKLNLHPVSILFFVIALGSLLGVAGALLAIPAAIVVKILWQEFYLKNRAPRKDALDAATNTVIRAGTRTARRKPVSRKPDPSR